MRTVWLCLLWSMAVYAVWLCWLSDHPTATAVLRGTACGLTAAAIASLRSVGDYGRCHLPTLIAALLLTAAAVAGWTAAPPSTPWVLGNCLVLTVIGVAGLWRYRFTPLFITMLCSGAACLLL